MMTKEAVNRAYETTLGRGAALRAPVFHSMFALEDQKEGMAAFAEKRQRQLPELLQRRAEDVAERSAGVGRAVLRDGFLLLGDFQRLDRDLHLAGLLVVGDDAGVDLLADGEALGALLVAVARQVGTLDEGGRGRFRRASLRCRHP
jgi:hypothetical protein